MAAGTYGEPGKNPFTLKGIGGILSPVVNASNGVTQIYRQGSGITFQSLGTFNPSTKKFTADSNANLSDAEIKTLNNTESINDIKGKAKEATVKGVIAAGGTEEEAAAKANKLITPNSGDAGTGDSQGGNAEGQDASEALKKDLNDLKEGTRYKKKSFSDLKYPNNLQIEHQDVIQFNMLSYEKRSYNDSSSGGLGSFGERSEYTTRTIGTVTLPVPGGISDTNQELSKCLVRKGHKVELINFKLLYPKLLFPGKTQYEKNSIHMKGPVSDIEEINFKI